MVPPTVLRLIDEHKTLCAFRVMMSITVDERGCWVFHSRRRGYWEMLVTPATSPVAYAHPADLAYYVYVGAEMPQSTAKCPHAGCVNPWHRYEPKLRPKPPALVRALTDLARKVNAVRCGMRRDSGRVRRFISSQPMIRLRRFARKPDLTKETMAERRRKRARRGRQKSLVRLKENLSCLIRVTLRKRGLSKNRSPTFSKLGYSPYDLYRHIERQFLKGMSWQNMGEWHIDHIIPLSSFRITGMDCPEFRAAWALTNLRPLWAEDNIRKGATRETLL